MNPSRLPSLRPLPAARSLLPLVAVLGLLGACSVSPTAAPSATPASSPKAAAAATPAAPATKPAPQSAAGASAPATATTTAATPSTATQSPAPQDREADFARWVEDFRASARAAGIDDATLHDALDGVRLLPRVVALDRAQPEFTRAIWDYLDAALALARVARGRAQLQQVRVPAEAAAQRYGVPPEVVLAIWGVESDYGRNVGDIPTVDALATLAFDGRRAHWARGQLMDALKILQRHDIARAQMLGSWAGAMGQTQFLPSAFLAYAVDADGDGRRDLWGSVPDVLASTANFLARSGWQTGQPWGLEVRLPADFDAARADSGLRQGAAAWAGEGVAAMDGGALPDLPEASILLPAGARGPAFLVGPNFRVLLRYNAAISYGLAVGLLAQQLQGGPAVRAPWPRELQPLSRSQQQSLQEALNARGFDAGTPDGMMGPATQRGIRAFQRSLGLPADGYPSTELLQRLP